MQPVDKIWMDGELVDWADAKVHVLTHGLHYGSGVFEGIRAYETDRGPAVFRLTDHLRRLEDSVKIALMADMPYSVEEMADAVKATMRANGLTSCYIRPLVYRGYGDMGLNPLSSPMAVSISMWPWGSYLGADGEAHGIKAKISSWKRHDPNIMPAAAKGAAMYLNSSLAKVEAIKAGYDESIELNSQGFVAEASAANVFVIRNGVITTPPTSDGALHGFRRDSVMTVARDSGIEVREASLIRSDLYVADEIFLTGTASEVVPVRSVDDREVGEPGPITKKIQQTMQDAVRGRVPQYEHWVEHVG